MTLELPTLAEWLTRPEPERLETLATLARELGPDFAAMHTPREPRDRLFRTSGARLVHRPSQLAFCLVPGGTFRMGLGEVEARELAEVLDDNDATLVGEDLGRMRPTRVVTVAPLLLAETPLPGDGPKPRRLEPHDLAHWLSKRASAGLRLPSEAEWEHAYRAGSTAAFPWGRWPPIAPPAVPHPLGLAMMGFWREAVADAWRADLAAHPRDGTPLAATPSQGRAQLATRGGGAERWPWEPMTAGWRPLLSAWRGAPRDLASHDPRVRRAALRPALALPAPRPEPRSLPEDAPGWTMATETARALVRLAAADPAARRSGRAELAHLARPRLGPSDQAALALPDLLDLALDPAACERAELLALAVELAASARSTPSAAATAMHAALVARAARLEAVASAADPALGSAARLLLERVARAPTTTATGG